MQPCSQRSNTWLVPPQDGTRVTLPSVLSGILSFSWRGKGPSYCIYIILCILPSFIITAFVPYPQGHGIKSGSWEALEREREAFTTVTASEFHPRLLRAALLRLSPDFHVPRILHPRQSFSCPVLSSWFSLSLPSSLCAPLTAPIKAPLYCWFKSVGP